MCPLSITYRPSRAASSAPKHSRNTAKQARPAALTAADDAAAGEAGVAAIRNAPLTAQSARDQDKLVATAGANLCSTANGPRTVIGAGTRLAVCVNGGGVTPR